MQTLPQLELSSTEQPVQVVQDDEGFLWYGTNGTGLCRFDGYESEMFRSDRQRPHLLLSNDVLCIAEQKDNAEIWFGTKDGAYILNKHDYSIRPIVVGPSSDDQQAATAQSNELADKRITCMLTARDGSVWLSYRNQLLHLSASAELLERFETSWNGKNRSIVSLCFDDGDALWMGLWNGGIVSLRETKGKWSLENGEWRRSDYPAKVEWIASRKALLVASSDGSSLLYDPQTKSMELLNEYEISQLSIDNQTPPSASRKEWVDSIMRKMAPHNDSDVLSWAVLKDGRAYVGSYHSLFLCDHEHVERLEGDLGKVRSMAYSERLQTLFFLSRARGICAWKNQELKVLCDTTTYRYLQLQADTALLLSDGLTNVSQFNLRTHQLTTDTMAADLRILSTAYIFDGKKHLVGYGQRVITVPRETELVEIYLSTLDYERASRVQFAYRLNDGGAWTELPAGEHIAKFTHLPAGSNQLQVRATDAYGRWSAPVTVICLVRPKAWYAQPWLWLLLAAVLLAAIYYYIKVRAKKRSAASPSEEADAQPTSEAEEQADNTISVADKEFYDKAVAAVLANITNSAYSVDALASDLCMSRANLYRKMRTIMGLTPTDFIRNQRLERAAHLLRTTSHSVNEIADMVGFSYASYFTKCFKDKYGVLPKDY